MIAYGYIHCFNHSSHLCQVVWQRVKTQKERLWVTYVRLQLALLYEAKSSQWNQRHTWLCWLSWLLKVTVRFPAAALGTALVEYRDLLLSYELRRLQISMFWKHDFTLEKIERQHFSSCIKIFLYIWTFVVLITLTANCGDNPSGGSWWQRGDPEFL